MRRELFFKLRFCQLKADFFSPATTALHNFSPPSFTQFDQRFQEALQLNFQRFVNSRPRGFKAESRGYFQWNQAGM